MPPTPSSPSQSTIRPPRHLYPILAAILDPPQQQSVSNPTAAASPDPGPSAAAVSAVSIPTIEILPAGFEPVLFDPDANALGVTKRALVAAFVDARQVFSGRERRMGIEPGTGGCHRGVREGGSEGGSEGDGKNEAGDDKSGQSSYHSDGDGNDNGMEQEKRGRGGGRDKKGHGDPEAKQDVGPDPGPDDIDDTSLDTATRIILLYDSEHLTACNWRKRRLVRVLDNSAAAAAAERLPARQVQQLSLPSSHRRQHRQHQHQEQSCSQFHYQFCRELAFVTALLGSPLHRTAKSPLLWHHRRWLLTRLLGEENEIAGGAMQTGLGLGLELAVSIVDGSRGQEGGEADSGAEAEMDMDGDSEPPTSLGTSKHQWKRRLWLAQRLLDQEMQLAMRAGEHHPRNYYAWDHMRQVFDLVRFHVSSAVNDDGCSASVDTNTNTNITPSSLSTSPSCTAVSLAHHLLPPLESWCRAHTSDFSGWTFLLLFLLQHLPQETLTAVMRRVAAYAVRIGWEGEALWTVVGTAVGRYRIDIVGADRDWNSERENRGKARGGLDMVRTESEGKGWMAWIEWARSIRRTGVDTT